jgi:hypothetical protein
MKMNITDGRILVDVLESFFVIGAGAATIPSAGTSIGIGKLLSSA